MSNSSIHHVCKLPKFFYFLIVLYCAWHRFLSACHDRLVLIYHFDLWNGWVQNCFEKIIILHIKFWPNLSQPVTFKDILERGNLVFSPILTMLLSSGSHTLGWLTNVYRGWTFYSRAKIRLFRWANGLKHQIYGNAEYIMKHFSGELSCRAANTRLHKTAQDSQNSFSLLPTRTPPIPCWYTYQLPAHRLGHLVVSSFLEMDHAYSEFSSSVLSTLSS